MTLYLSKITLTLGLLSILIASCQENRTASSDTIYIDYNTIGSDATTQKCYSEIITNKDYVNLKFNDSSSVNPYQQKARSSFSYTTIVIDGIHFQEISLYASINAPITWGTMPPTFICSFRINPETNALTIFNTATKKFLDFRKDAGRIYFKACLNDFIKVHQIN